MAVEPLAALARAAPAPLVDPFGRTISYLRVSVTDRCDLRCTYCMPQRMTFLPRAELLTLEELDRVCSAFVDLGVGKLRLTGGEPLVRKDVMWLIERLSRHLATGALEELTLTTNASRLAAHADALAGFGVRRINVSLDSLDEATYARITRGGELARTLDGVAAAQAAGLKVKINTVALARDNAGELPAIIAWAHGQGCDISLIETMPMGEIGEDRQDQYLSLARVRESLAAFWTLDDLPDQTGGPSRYARVRETGGRLGFITPLSHNFCASCNRVRLTCTGVLYMCLGQQDSADLKPALRSGATGAELEGTIAEAVSRKPERHDFDALRLSRPAVARHMSMTGG
jgi:cyclic pyranopterin phosphate synthase